LSAGDFPEINSFSGKLAETKFSEFNTLSQSKLDELDRTLKEELPKLMAVRLSGWANIYAIHVLKLIKPLHQRSFQARRTRLRHCDQRVRRVLQRYQSRFQRASLARRPTIRTVIRLDIRRKIRITIGTLNKRRLLLVEHGTATHTFKTRRVYHRALQDSADRLRSSFEALGPEGGYLSTQKARDVLVR